MVTSLTQIYFNLCVHWCLLQAWAESKWRTILESHITVYIS